MMTVSALLTIIVVGLIIGFIANSIMGAGGMGLLWTIVIGLVGSFVGHFLFTLLGIVVFGPFGEILAGVIGACLLIFIIRKMRQA